MPREKEKLLIENGTLKVTQVMQEAQGNPASNIWTAEVWRLDQINLNGRIYPRSLAERVVRDNTKTMAYDGHDADWRSGHDFAPAVAYCDNPRIDGNALVVDIHFLESQTDCTSVRNIRELYKAGLPIGVSSVGYGSVDENGIVQDDYEVVRYLDFVAQPAGLVYAEPKTENHDPEPEEEPKGEPMGEPEDPAMAEAKQRAIDQFRKNLSRRNAK